jgi:hypothetical protein
MVGHIVHRFCDEQRYNPRFRFKRSSASERVQDRWNSQYRKAERIDPEPTGLRAIRESHPDIKHPGLPDLLTVASTPVVCEAFRQIVLELEPDVHQFVPIALYDEAEQPLPGTYWVMNVLQCRDCVVRPEQVKKWEAEGYLFPEVEQFWRRHKNARRALTLYLDKSRIEGLHLWRPTYPQYPLGQSLYLFEFLVSDELLLRVDRAKLRKLSARPAVEMSVPLPRQPI